jgi:sigma-B regulation protein RsbU (phosphoserine phosphatase)
MTQPRKQALLLLDEGASQRKIELQHLPFTIGRLPDRDLVLPDSHISRRHAQIVEENGQFFLLDEGSQSGTYVNNWRVQRQVLHDGDVIQVGSVDAAHLRFHLQDETSITSLRELLAQIPDTSGSESNLAKLGWFVEAARRLNDYGAVNEILTVLIESTLQLTRAERGFVFLCNSVNQLELAVGRNTRSETLTDDETVSRSAIEQAIQSESEFIVTDTLSAEAAEPSMSIIAHNLRTIICIPLRRGSGSPGAQKRQVLGVLYLDSRHQRGKLTQVDSNLLNVIASEAAVMVQNATMVQAEEDARLYRAELQIAYDIQQGLMKVRLPKLSYAEVNAQNLPCREIGGDFFDAVANAEGLSVVVADVSGKGVSAAMLGATLQGLIHAQLLAGQELAQIASLANEFICGKDVGKYATLVLLRLAPTGQVEYINCGHVQPLLQAQREVRLLTNGNLPVGLLRGTSYTAERFSMQPGERVVIVTDGITEAEDRAGESFGDTAMPRAIGQGTGLPQLLELLSTFTAGAPLEDDCTVLEVCYAVCGTAAVAEPLR